MAPYSSGLDQICALTQAFVAKEFSHENSLEIIIIFQLDAQVL